MNIIQTHPQLMFQVQEWQYCLTTTTVNTLHSLHTVQGAIVASYLEVLGLSVMLTNILTFALTTQLTSTVQLSSQTCRANNLNAALHLRTINSMTHFHCSLIL